MPIANRVIFSLAVLSTEQHCLFHDNFTHYRHHVILSIVLEQTADSVLVTL